VDQGLSGSKYLVSWKGDWDPTWEPEYLMKKDCPILVMKFVERRSKETPQVTLIDSP